MKKIVLLIGFFGFQLNLYSQNIASARDQGEGAIVTISGVVTNGAELGDIRYIEDATAALAVYDPEVMSSVNRGDSITVTGVLFDYNGLLEVQPVNDLINHGSGYEIYPQIITPNQIGENTESELVSIETVSYTHLRAHETS
mgnify:CR=1 FL=1